MRKVEILFGLPGAGKTTHIRDQIDKGRKAAVISPDDLRQMFAGGEYKNYKFSHKNENIIFSTAQDMFRRIAETSDYDIFIDSTGINKKHRAIWIGLAKTFGFEVQVTKITTDDKLCLLRRLSDTKGGDTDWDEIIQRMKSGMQQPEISEGITIIEVL